MPVIVYLDMCCLKRAFDDQRSPRIQMETAAVASLMEAAAKDRIRLVRSPAHEFENARNPRDDRRLAAALWLATADQPVALESAVEERARTLAAAGFAPLDALHAALAEAAGARWLVTTDDRLVRLGQRPGLDLRTEIANPTLVVQALAGGTP